MAASFTELAGGSFKANEMDGKNLIPYLTGKESGQPHESLKWRFTISAAMVSGDWKLVRLPDRLPMLYNLKTDLAEKNNSILRAGSPRKNAQRIRVTGDGRLPHPIFMEGARWKKKNN